MFKSKKERDALSDIRSFQLLIANYQLTRAGS